MEPQAESIANISTKEIYASMEVVIPDEVKYCPYTGSYEEMIHKAMKDKNLPVVRSLIEYRDAMNERDKKVKELFNKSHDIRPKVTDFITSDEELDDESDYDPGYSLTDSDEEDDDFYIPQLSSPKFHPVFASSSHQGGLASSVLSDVARQNQEMAEKEEAIKERVKKRMSIRLSERRSMRKSMAQSLLSGKVK